MLGICLAFGLSTVAHAGELVIDTQVPVEVFVDDLPQVRLYHAGQARIEVSAGRHRLSVYRGAEPEVLLADFVEEGDVVLYVGATTLSLGTSAPPPPTPPGPASVEFRAPPGPGAQVHVGGERRLLTAQAPQVLEGLEPGTLELEVRSADGAFVWARGELELVSGDALVVVLPEGRPPEVFGRPDAWHPGG